MSILGCNEGEIIRLGKQTVWFTCLSCLSQSTVSVLFRLKKYVTCLLLFLSLSFSMEHHSRSSNYQFVKWNLLPFIHPSTIRTPSLEIFKVFIYYSMHHLKYNLSVPNITLKYPLPVFWISIIRTACRNWKLLQKKIWFNVYLVTWMAISGTAVHQWLECAVNFSVKHVFSNCKSGKLAGIIWMPLKLVEQVIKRDLILVINRNRQYL